MKTFAHILLLATVVTAAGAVPQQINYQGYLASPDGVPLDTVVDLRFSLWDAPVGGNNFWVEFHSAASIVDGLFNVQLGEFSPITDDDFDRPQLWLGLRVGNDQEMTPRRQIVSVGYAYRVSSVHGASGGTISGDVTIDGRGNIGTNNLNPGIGAFVTGSNNRARGNYSVVGGGGGSAPMDSNAASNIWATIGGGSSNDATDSAVTIAGGRNNSSNGRYATIGGGYNNTANGNWATVSGGQNNSASNNYTVVVGGGGPNAADGNIASGRNSVAVGGQKNIASGHFSLAGGYNSRAAHSGCFVWSDSSAADTLSSSTPDQFSVRASGGARFYTNTTQTSGVTLAAGGGAWNAVSDSTRKRNRRRVDPAEILDKVARLPIERWSYKSQDPSIEHMGPMAQDFWNAFHLGESDTTISTLDPDGVLFAAVQELAKRLQAAEEQNTELRSRVQTLEAVVKQSSNLDRK